MAQKDANIVLLAGVTNTVIGGVNAGEGNVINGPNGVSIQSGTATGTVIQGNSFGLNAARTTTLGTGTSCGICTFASNTTVGGTAAGAGNVITGYAFGVVISAPASGSAILGNSIYGNATMGIDLGGGGITANDGAKPAGTPNLQMDFPVFTNATMTGSTLTVSGYVGSAAGQSLFAGARVEIFGSDGTQTNGQGKTYLGFLTTDANGNFSGTVTGVSGVVNGSSKLTATATDGASNTSEFGPNVLVGLTVGGTVFEDVNYGGGAGRSQASAGGAAVSGARVELYDNGGAYLASTSTASDGSYIFRSLASATYYVRVVSSTVLSTRTGSTSALLGVLTYRTDGSTGTATPVTNYVGGTNPALADPGAGAVATSFNTSTLVFTAGLSGTAQNVSTVSAANGSVSGLDFGFNFDTVVNTNDSGQGSLRQAITNANTLGGDASLAVAGRTAGIEHVVFMIPNGSTGSGGSAAVTGGLRSSINLFTTSAGSYNVATITPTSALPSLTTTMVLDAQTQPGWTQAPLVEINGASAAGVVATINIDAASTTVRGLVLNRSTGQGLRVTANGGNAVVQGNYIGTTASGLAASANTYEGVKAYGANLLLGGTTAAQRNVISGNAFAQLKIDVGATANVIQGNYIGVGADGATKVANAQYFAVGLYSSGHTVGGTAAGAGNVIVGAPSSGVYLQGSSNNTIQGNYIGTNAAGATGLGNTAEGVALDATSANNLIGGSAAGAGNVISGNGTSGVLTFGSNNTVQGNIIGLNPAATTALPNGVYGVVVRAGATGTLVGGTATGAGNVISGNANHGVYILGNNTTLQGNVIGTNAAGSTTVGNGGAGINTGSGITGTQIGGTAAGAGNVISGNTQQAIYLWGGSTTVEGNTIGLAPDGMAAVPNKSYNIGLGNGAVATIGGATSASRNLIASSTSYGVMLTTNSTNAVTISNNWIGLARDGVTARGNAGHGVAVWTGSNNASITNNVISANSVGVWIGSGTGHVITGNLIGTDSTGTIAKGNSYSGVAISDGAVATVGGTTAGLANTIANNGAAGVLVANGGVARITGNSIYANTGLGIDLVSNTMASMAAPGDGVTANDGAKTTGKSNQLMDFPVITSAVVTSKQFTVSGYVGSAAGQSAFAGATVEVFVAAADPSGYGEGKTYLGALTADANGNFSGTVTVTNGASIAPTDWLTATATDASGNTSEFALTVQPTFALVVNHNGDDADVTPGDGACTSAVDVNRCTLRAAIQESNALAGKQMIMFALPNCPGAGCTITPASALPTITDAVIINGQSQTGWVSAPLVEIKGSSAGAVGGLYLDVNAGGSIINGLVINGFAGNALKINSTAAVTVQGNYVGTNAAGSASGGNGSNGVMVNAGSGHLIGGTGISQGNVISGNALRGIELAAGTSNITIQGNYVGTDATGAFAIANSYNGIHIHDSTDDIVGGAGAARNVISGNVFNGIEIDGYSSTTHRVQVLGNYIGTNASGTAAIPNTGSGITLGNSSGNVIGGALGSTGNLISGNLTTAVANGAGISLQNGSTSNTIKGNLIGLNAAGTAALANGGYGVLAASAGNTLGGTSATDRNVIAGNSSYGVYLNANNTQVQGNWIGLNAAGTAAVPNAMGVRIASGITGSGIGGTTAGAGNVIAGNAGQGILSLGASASIQGNFIGLDATGTVAVPNGSHGIDIQGSNHLVGGISYASGGNLISGNGGVGVAIDGGNGAGTGNVVSANLIGLNVTGQTVVGNTGDGIYIWRGAAGNVVGGTASGRGNVISGNGRGVTVASDGGTGNAVLGNAIFGNRSLGIDLGADGVTANDGAKTVGKPNLNMDFPVFTSARARGNLLTVAGYVGSAAGQSVFAGSRVEVFASDGDASGYGEGSVYLGTLTADASGNFSGTLTMPAATIKIGTKLTGTATDASNNTSEFGPNFGSLAVDLVVNDNGDAADANPGDGYCATATGVCTLRAALAEANAWPQATTIAFALPNCPGAGCKISPASALPLPQRVLNVDGSTQAGYAGTPLVWLDGSGAGTVNGIQFNTGSSGSVVRGLSVTGFSSSQGRAFAVFVPSITLVGNYIGLAPDGTTVAGNRVGVEIASANNLVGGIAVADMNRAAGNTYSFTFATSAATGNRVIGNTVGLGGDGVTVVNGGTNALYVWGGASGNYFGGTNAGEGNVVRSTVKAVMMLNASLANSVLGNSMAGSSSLGIDLGNDGVTVNTGTTNASLPNNGMNYPVITGAGVGTNSLTTYGYIGTNTGQATFAGARVEFFKAAVNAAGYGDGQVYLGALTADANGRFSGTVSFAANVLAVGDVITATATDTNGNTSEFGPNRATTSVAALTPGGFNAFDVGTAANALSGTIGSKTAGASASLAVIALDNSGSNLHPGFTGNVSLSWVDARDDGGSLNGSCRGSWVDLGAAGTAAFVNNNRVTVSVTPPATSTRVMRLRMTYTANGTTTTACSNDAFAALPASLAWIGATDGDSATAGTTRSLDNVADSGGVVHKAGRPFTLRARALDATGAVMTGYDGTPVLASAGCVLPAGCTGGALTGANVAAVAGLYTHNAVSYAEVGALQVQLTDTTYGDVDVNDTPANTRRIASGALAVGRFVPDNYTLALAAAPSLHTANAACTKPGAGYTFIGQPTGWASAPQITVTARNAAGGITSYWSGALMKLLPANLVPAMVVANAGTASLGSTWGTVTVSDLGGGQVQATASNTDSFKLSVATTQATVSPSFTWSLALTDASEAATAGNPTLTASVSQANVAFDGGSLFHSGRLNLTGGNGDARVGVKMLLQMQRLTSTGWATMTEDQGCISVPTSALTASQATGIFTTAGVCAAPPAGTATTAGGRAWLVLPAAPGGKTGSLQWQLMLDGASGTACQAAGQTRAAQSLQKAWLLPPGVTVGPAAKASWGLPSRDLMYRHELF